MSERDFDAVFYIKKPPTIRYEDGMFFICYKVGSAQFEFVLRPSVWRQTRRAADGADKQFGEREAPVSQMQQKPPAAH